jgi:uncharacterized protein (DUF302 family)
MQNVGVQVRRSTKGYGDTRDALLAGIERRGLTVFAQIDHAASARDAGLELDDEAVIAFGNPLSGTPLMQDDPRVGIELPLRMLVWRERADVLVGHDDPRELAERYDVAMHRATLDQMASLLDELAEEAAGDAA